jgi:hypothetical protein
VLNSIWIELHQEMPKHPKTLALAQALKVSRREAVGILIDLWTWGLSCADEDGSLKSIGDEGIALALDWPIKKSGVLVKAFVGCGWLDDLGNGQYRLHDWPDYTSRLSEKRKDAERKRAARKATKQADKSEHRPQNVRGQSPDSPEQNAVNPRAGITPPNQTEPNHGLSVINTPSSPTVEEDGAGPDFGTVCQAFENTVKPMPSPKDGTILSELYRDYPIQRVLDAIAETARCNGRSASYVRSVLQNADREAKAPPGSSSGPDLTDPERYKNFGRCAE